MLRLIYSLLSNSLLSRYDKSQFLKKSTFTIKVETNSLLSRCDKSQILKKSTFTNKLLTKIIVQINRYIISFCTNIIIPKLVLILYFILYFLFIKCPVLCSVLCRFLNLIFFIMEVYNKLVNIIVPYIHNILIKYSLSYSILLYLYREYKFIIKGELSPNVLLVISLYILYDCNIFNIMLLILLWLNSLFIYYLQVNTSIKNNSPIIYNILKDISSIINICIAFYFLEAILIVIVKPLLQKAWGIILKMAGNNSQNNHSDSDSNQSSDKNPNDPNDPNDPDNKITKNDKIKERKREKRKQKAESEGRIFRGRIKSEEERLERAAEKKAKCNAKKREKRKQKAESEGRTVKTPIPWSDLTFDETWERITKQEDAKREYRREKRRQKAESEGRTYRERVRARWGHLPEEETSERKLEKKAIRNAKKRESWKQKSILEGKSVRKNLSDFTDQERLERRREQRRNSYQKKKLSKE